MLCRVLDDAARAADLSLAELEAWPAEARAAVEALAPADRASAQAQVDRAAAAVRRWTEERRKAAELRHDAGGKADEQEATRRLEETRDMMRQELGRMAE